jgi:hypothetical protein
VVGSTEVIHVMAAFLANRSTSLRMLTRRIVADIIINFFLNIFRRLKFAEDFILSE